ncbi:MAG TPA: lysoplasmalogenase family protein [Pseudobacteroides sp.]|nr:lysoplasmalogenase family protein [Pseudobacteroides sp.]
MIYLVIAFQLGLVVAGIAFPDLSKLFDMIASFSIVTTSFVLWRKYNYIYNKFVSFAMIFCFIGDLTMASIIPLPNNFIGGMLVFSVAHILLINCFVKTAKFYGRSLFTPKLTVSITFYLIINTVTWWFCILNTSKLAISIGALVYGIIIGIMAAFALTLHLTLGKRYMLAAAGSAFFILSDTVIGMARIKGLPISNSHALIWLTYISALMGLIYSNIVVEND